MENVNSNTPIYVVQKTREEANKEMKEATKRELENLSKALKNRAEKEVPFVEEFFINPLDNGEDADDVISISTDSTSDSTRNLITAISGLKNNKREKKLEKKLLKNQKKQNHSNNRHDLVDNVVMVEKLKHEIEKLESRLRYRDLDMSNLNVEILSLQKVVDTYNMIEKILKNIQDKEIYLVDNHRKLNDIINSNDLSQKLVRLTDFSSSERSKSLSSVDPKFNFDENIITINNKMLVSLITQKENQITSDYNQFKNKITVSIEKTKIEKSTETVIMGTSILLVIWFLTHIYFRFF
jgi:hypothetical protein